MLRSLLVFAGLLAAGPVAAAELSLTYIAASSVALDNPHDLKLSPDGRFLYVADVGNNRVAILDPQTLELRGEFGAGHQSGTHDIDFDNRGRAYVADTHNNRVLIYAVDGLAGRTRGTAGCPHSRAGRRAGARQRPGVRGRCLVR